MTPSPCNDMFRSNPPRRSADSRLEMRASARPSGAFAAIAALTFGCAPAGLAAQAVAHTVVPASHDQVDAVGFAWLPGAEHPLRQQTLIGASHLAALVGRELTAIEFRRDQAGAAAVGGTCAMTARLSISPRQPLQSSTTFADNVGGGSVEVFSGLVDLPAGPATASGPWTPQNVTRIEFATPFAYQGGTLCVDIRGDLVPGQLPVRWMADLAAEDLTGSVQDLGGGCGGFGGAEHRWAFCAERSLLPGGRAQFFADGPTHGIAFAIFGQPSGVGVALTDLGWPALPECELHLTTIDAIVPAVFEDPGMAIPASAAVELGLPATAAVLGLTLGCQWLECSQLATSNTLAWTIAPTIPTLDVTLIEGDPGEANGNVSVGQSHVLRIESH